MKKPHLYLPEYRAKELAYVTDIIFEELPNVQMVILFGSYARVNWVEDIYTSGRSTYECDSDFDILVLAEVPKDANYSDLPSKVENRLSSAKAVINLIFHHVIQANNNLGNGWFLFTDVRKKGLLLQHSKRFNLGKRRMLNLEEQKEILRSFYRNFEYSLRMCYHKTVAFELHQTKERFYLAILMTFTGKRDETDNIKQSADFNPTTSKVLYCVTKEQARVFKFLKKAYIDAHNYTLYKITGRGLRYLSKRIKILQKLTKQICKKQIDSL